MEDNSNAIKNIDLESIEDSALVKGVSDFLYESRSENSQLIDEGKNLSGLKLVEKELPRLETNILNAELASVLS
jgi:septal ring factor EnvC (AmiA/AmiB activator)